MFSCKLWVAGGTYLEILVLVACACGAQVLVFFAGVLPVVPGHAEFFEEDWLADFSGPLG